MRGIEPWALQATALSLSYIPTPCLLGVMSESASTWQWLNFYLSFRKFYFNNLLFFPIIVDGILATVDTLNFLLGFDDFSP